MKRDIKFWQYIGFFVVSLLGTLLHFIFDWTGNPIAALFSSVNESTWEHMKLLFFPMFLFSIAERFVIGKNYKNFWCIKLKGILLGLLLIPLIFYTLKGIFGTTPDFINIAVFFVSVAAGFIYETKQFKKDSLKCKYEKSAFILICLISALFMIFTFFPPEIPLFKDPIDGRFGI